MESSILIVLLALAGGWGLQMWLAARQARAFQNRVLAMRRKGATAVGRAGKSVRGVAYCALSSSPDGKVTGAVALKGVTVFARPEPLSELVGKSVSDVAGAGGGVVEQAAAAAALMLLDREVTGPSS